MRARRTTLASARRLPYREEFGRLVEQTSQVAWDSVTAPPLTVEDEHVEMAVTALQTALDQLGQSPASRA